MAFSPAVSPAATPKPISARANTSVEKLSDTANSAAPPAAMSSKALWTRRGPWRSSMTPMGI
jgi:hypothetical protein